MSEPVIRKLNEESYAVEDSGVRFFVLKGTEKAILVDSGMHFADVRKTAQELAGMPVELINTHADMDHVGGNGQFERFMMHPAEICNFEARGRKEGEILPVYEGDQIDLGGRVIEIIHTRLENGKDVSADEKAKCFLPVKGVVIMLCGGESAQPRLTGRETTLSSLTGTIVSSDPQEASYLIRFDSMATERTLAAAVKLEVLSRP